MNIKIIDGSVPKPMKVINMSNLSSEKAYLTRPPEDTHSEEELASLYNAIRFTKTFMQKESLDKMDEESALTLKLPK